MKYFKWHILLIVIVLLFFAGKPVGSALVYYGHVVSSGYGTAIGFDAPYRRLTNGVLETVLNLRKGIFPERRTGLPQVRLYITEQAQKNLLRNIPSSVSKWQKARLLYPDNKLRSVKVRHRGDANAMNFVLSKKSWRIKTKKSQLFNSRRVINYVFPQTEDMIEEAVISKLALKVGVLAPKVVPVELFVNDKSRGILYEWEHLDELFLRSNKIMPVNLYKGDTDRGLPLGLATNLFQSPSLWSKISQNNRYEESDRRDLERFFNHIRKAASSPKDYEELKKMAPHHVWARFAAFQVLTQSWHNNTGSNQRLIIDDQSGEVAPVLWDTGFSNTFRDGYHFNFDSQPLLNLYLRDSAFIFMKINYLYELVVEDQVLKTVDEFVDEIATPFIISLQRDSGRSAVIPVSSTSRFLLHPDEAPLKHKALVEAFGRIGHWLNDILTADPVTSWAPTDHGLTLFVDGIVPVGNVSVVPTQGSPIPGRIYLDIDEDGEFGNLDMEVPFTVQNGVVRINAIWLANRTSKLIAPTNYGTNDLHDNGIEVVPTAFSLVFEGASGESLLGISEVTAQNPLTKAIVRLNNSIERASAPNRFNRPLISNPVSPSEVWRGTREIGGKEVVDHSVRIEAGTVIKMAEGASLIFRKKLVVNGQADNPVRVIAGSDKPWGTFALQGNGTAGSTLNHLHLRDGSGADHAGVKYLAMLSMHSTSDIEVRGLRLTDNHFEDDMMHIVYGDRIRLKDIGFDKARSDALDIDLSHVTISGGTIHRAGNDCLDFMTSEVLVHNITLSNCGDKGISVGEASRSVIVNAVIQNSSIGVESKDRSEATILYSDLLNNKIQVNAYQKNWRYSRGGKINLSKSYLASLKNSLKTDKKSGITVVDSAILNTVNASRRVQFSNDVDFFDNRIARSTKVDTQLLHQVPSDILLKYSGRRGAMPR